MTLFNKKFIGKQIAIMPTPDSARVSAFKSWSDSIKSGRVKQLKETELHGPFMDLMIKALGYTGPVGSDHYSITQEKAIVQGSVDLALGHFTNEDRKIIAPFELKGADTRNLDAIMSGRAKTPVDQAWEYATNNVGTKWVLISNYLEIRLYSYSEGRQVYETFDLSKTHEPAEYARVQSLLSAENLLSGRTLELLEESRRENKNITNALYQDYKKLRGELINQVRVELPDLDPLLAIRTGQTILDRILFIAFAEDTGLLPSRILESAFQTTNAFAPAPVWTNFQGLFTAIDQGSPPLKVPRYNGGLFAPNEIINALSMPDHICEGFKALSEYDFASEISVTVLGHIFEQSIADIEQLQAEARGESVEAKKTTGTSGRRKRDGVVYTPDYIARFIVEQTLGTHCREIFDGLLLDHAQKGASRADDPIKWKSAAEKKFWQEYRDRIAKLRIVDPACGSGVFLVMAFDWLKAELMRCNSALEKLGEGALFEPDSEILTHNLFGVDVNEESVEIAKLSLWIKTARHGKVLDSLDYNFRVGDSLIEDSSYAYRSHGFVWKEAFKDIFAEGGFDIVLGNPPYVAMGLFKELKGYLKKRYEVAADRTDLSSYFIERAIKILKNGGRVGFISSATFFKTASGKPLRQYLKRELLLESIVDFGDIQIFDGVSTLPMIFVGRKSTVNPHSKFAYWPVAMLPEDFENTFYTMSQPCRQASLSDDGWELEGENLQDIREKLKGSNPVLKSVYGPALRGIVTGLNEAFIIADSVAAQLMQDDPASRQLIKPFLGGRDLERWGSDPRGMKLLYIPQSGLDIEHFPAINNWLGSFREALDNRATEQKWFELQQPQQAYQNAFENSKICYPEFSRGPEFSVVKGQCYPNNKVFFFPFVDYHLLGLLNSKALWFLLYKMCAFVIGGSREIRAQYIETLPIPPATDDQKAELAALAEAAQNAAEARYALQQEITRRIPDLATGMAIKLSERLKTWWDLPDFAAFQAEVKKALKSEIPLKDRNDWENWISENRAKIHALTADIARVENEINEKVYALFDLTPDEIALLEANI